VVIDPYDVSAANLSRSVYRWADVGRPKVAALAEHLQAVGGPRVNVTAIQDDVGATLTAPGPVVDCDLLVLTTDDPAAELQVNLHCYRAGIALVSAKLYRGAEAGEVAWIAPHRRSPCLRCLTVGRGRTLHRRTDYGTGRLVAESALGTDIAVVVPQGARLALALLADRDAHRDARADPGRLVTPPLAAWFDRLASQGKVLAITSTVTGWPLFAAMGDPLWADPWATVWIRATRAPECAVCGIG
jgi:hypothetical protein